MKNLKRVIECFENQTQDIEDVLYKPYLKTASISHITTDTGLPKEFVSKVVELIYLSEDC